MSNYRYRRLTVNSSNLAVLLFSELCGTSSFTALNFSENESRQKCHTCMPHTDGLCTCETRIRQVQNSFKSTWYFKLLSFRLLTDRVRERRSRRGTGKPLLETVSGSSCTPS